MSAHAPSAAVTFVCALLVLPAVPAAGQGRFELVPSVSVSTMYDSNVFSVLEEGGDTLTLLTPSIEGVYEAPRATTRAAYSFTMQRAQTFDSLNSMDAARHMLLDTRVQLSPQLQFSALGRFDVSDRPEDLLVDTGILLGRQRGHRFQALPSLTYSITPRTSVSAQYDVIKEKLGDIEGDMYVARVGVSRQQTPRDSWSIAYLGRTVPAPDIPLTAIVTERSHGALVGYTRLFGPGTSLLIEGGPRRSSTGELSPEFGTTFTGQTRAARVALEYWQGETIVLGVVGPTEVRRAALRSNWTLTPTMDLGVMAAMFDSESRAGERAQVLHPEVSFSYGLGSHYQISASYGVDFQRGDIRSAPLPDRDLVRHVVLFRFAVGPRIGRPTPPVTPEDQRSRGVSR